MSRKIILILIIFLLLVGGIFVGINYLKIKKTSISEETLKVIQKEITPEEATPEEILKTHWNLVKENNLSEAQRYFAKDYLDYVISESGNFEEFVKTHFPYYGFQKMEITETEWLPEGEFERTQVRIYATKWWKDEEDGKIEEYPGIDYLMKEGNGWEIRLHPLLGLEPAERVKNLYILASQGKFDETEKLLTPYSLKEIKSEGGLKPRFEKIFNDRKLEKVTIEGVKPDGPWPVVKEDEIRWVHDFWLGGYIYFTDGSKEVITHHLADVDGKFKIGYRE